MESTLSSSAKQKRIPWKPRPDWLEMLVLLVPAVLLLTAFVILPTIEAFVMSFQREGLGLRRV